MIRNTVVNTLTFYYALGNTPAVSLTQDLPLEEDADILLLGCGDVRNVLFTSFADPGRRLDVTCCDIEPAILARNILILTLISDGKAKDGDLWSIYYHIKLDKDANEVMQEQLQRLLLLSTSIDQWDDGAYGSWIAFCDQRTFKSVRQLWQRWCSHDLSTEEDLGQKKTLAQSYARTLDIKRKFHGDEALNVGCARSASPASVESVGTLPQVSNHWWKTGIVDKDKDRIARSTLLNPSFLITSNPGVVLHYGQEPLNGFPLAPAYVPLDKQSELYTQQSASSFAPAVATARTTFSLWSKAFRKTLQLGSVLRFCAADALATCHTLQNATDRSRTVSANLAYDNWTSQALLINVGEHDSRRSAPTKFNVIDSSNLIDHLGALNIIVAAAPLLKPALSSTLYTEVLVQNEENQAKQLNSLLCGDFKTMSILLGLSPVELWTNATGNNEADEGMLGAIYKGDKELNSRGTQSMTRLRWKLLPNHDAPTIKMESDALAGLLTATYENMFRHEDVMNYVADFNHAMATLSNPYYTRAGFAALVKFVKKNIATDWDKAMELFLQQQALVSSPMTVTKNFLTDLKTEMCLTGLVPNTVIDQGSKRPASTSSKLPLASWDSIPAVVCVTIEIPRKTFRVITEMQTGTAGIPVLGGAIWFRDASGREPYHFSAVQVGFGRALTSRRGTADEQIEVVDGDEGGWAGRSSVVISVLCPSSLLLQNADGVVGIRLQPTPQSLGIFGLTLGPEMCLFECPLTDQSLVHITRSQPGSRGLPVLLGPQTATKIGDGAGVGYRTSVSIQLDSNLLSTLTGRIDFDSDVAKKVLEDKNNAVAVQFPTPIVADICIGKKTYRILFPSPVAGSKHKLRIARKSSYIEVLAPLWDPLGPEASTFMFPTSFSVLANRCSPTSWNSQRVNLDLMPKINIQVLKRERYPWLTTHLSLAFSDRERKIREAGLGTGNLSTNVRVELKEGLFSIMMQFTGIQGRQAEFFGLAKQESGVHVLLFPAALRLDLVNRSVALDTAIIPLTPAFLQDRKLMTFLQSMTEKGVMQIKVSDAELKCWKSIMPALVERCRTWHHAAACEYTKTKAIPLTLEDNRTPLCSCGLGKFPPNYLQTSVSKLSHFDYVMRKYATRAAISPVFAVSYVESCFLTDYPRDSKGLPLIPIAGASDRECCRKCGAAKVKETGSAGLLQCSRCKKVRYCSKECQKADWKVHKPVCDSIYVGG